MKRDILLENIFVENISSIYIYLYLYKDKKPLFSLFMSGIGQLRILYQRPERLRQGRQTFRGSCPRSYKGRESWLRFELFLFIPC